MTSAGKVKIAPAATASPADAIVCTTLFSSWVAPPRMRRTPIEMTAAGMLADTVIPAYRPRYAFAAPKITASSRPSTSPRMVNSRGAQLDAWLADDGASDRGRSRGLSGGGKAFGQCEPALVQGAAGNRADHPLTESRAQTPDVIERGDAARGDNRYAARPRHPRVLVAIDSGRGAVARDIGVDDHCHAGALEERSGFLNPKRTGLDPSLDRQPPTAHVERSEHAPGKQAAQLKQQRLI